MSNDRSGRDSEDPHIREAVRWLVKLQHRNLSARQLLRWNEWQESPRNREAFDSLEPIWRAMHASVDSSSRVRTLSEEAAYWYVRCADNPRMPRSALLEFMAWMRGSPENIAELLKIAQVHGHLHRCKLRTRTRKLSNVIELTMPHPPNGQHRGSMDLEENDTKESAEHRRALSPKLRIVAMILCVGVTAIFAARYFMTPKQIVAVTGAGQLRDMKLPDGTAVDVDARSKVRAEYTRDARIVYVDEGGAVFDVVEDPNRPFIARTPLVDVTAVGTRFGVSIATGVTTTVAEGKVTVKGRKQVDGKSVIVNAGEELRVSDSSLTSPQVAAVDAESKLQWAKDGMLALGGLPVAQAVAELNWRNEMQILVESPTLGAKVLAVANVRVDSPRSYANLVAANPGVTMRVDEKNGVIRLSE